MIIVASLKYLPLLTIELNIANFISLDNDNKHCEWRTLWTNQHLWTSILMVSTFRVRSFNKNYFWCTKKHKQKYNKSNKRWNKKAAMLTTDLVPLSISICWEFGGTRQNNKMNIFQEIKRGALRWAYTWYVFLISRSVYWLYANFSCVYFQEENEIDNRKKKNNQQKISSPGTKQKMVLNSTDVRTQFTWLRFWSLLLFVFDFYDFSRLSFIENQLNLETLAYSVKSVWQFMFSFDCQF